MATTAVERDKVRERQPAGQGLSHPLSMMIAGLGAVYMLLLVFGIFLPPAGPYIGTRLYDLYTAALLDGHFDLPARELRLEGHYTPDGTGYLYHGLGPVLTRLPFAAFVEFPTRWIAPLSIWFWAVAGNVCVHKTFSFALARADFGGKEVPGGVSTLLAIAVWFGAPGIILAANASLFHEPVAMAYALGAGIVLLLSRLSFGAIPLERVLLPLAVLAGLTLHARPHLGGGYGVILGIIALYALWRNWRRCWLRVTAACAVLGLFGALLIASNAMRFGDPGRMHGSFGKSETQYGWVYWGAETQDSERARGFRQYGQFNALRIPPSAAMYLASPPPALAGPGLSQAIEDLFHSAGPWVSHMRLEQPNIGVLFLWPLWLLAMAFGLRRRKLRKLPAFAGITGIAAGSLLLLSYATITLRYHVDLWPLIAFPAVFGVAPMVAWARRRHQGGKSWQPMLGLLLLTGIVSTSLAVGGSRSALLDDDRFWTHDACLKLVEAKGFDKLRGAEICRIGYQ